MNFLYISSFLSGGGLNKILSQYMGAACKSECGICDTCTHVTVFSIILAFDDRRNAV